MNPLKVDKAAAVRAAAIRATAKGKKKKAAKKNDKGKEPEEPAEPKPAEDQPVEVIKNWFLLQYCNGEKVVVHSIVERENVSWPSGLRPGLRQVFYKMSNGDVKLATVMFCHENEAYMREQFERLKTWVYDMCCSELRDPREENDVAWYLIQYTCGDNSVVYKLMASAMAKSQYTNNYKNSTMLFSIGPLLYQGLVVRKERYYERILILFKNLRDNCAIVMMPLQMANLENYGTNFALPRPNFKSVHETSAKFERKELTLQQFNRLSFYTFHREQDIRLEQSKEIQRRKLMRYIRSDISEIFL